ncbi:solute carrier family 35 member F6 [Danaus plexippus]|uniref:Transmembrane protein C2orf18 n=1 Tax=Danaus plexippus plexippus TaxID=278856 RepID=A0A212EKF5_DANPL|nr:solute carrier family 35 member F6 [Danaus plexippus]XP_032527944.1 solute carrier family 35 member F6 [Danaus plexippus]OWR41967.1 putative Transmembrane protein C2orf18 [Danaus plexippus plexippus]
MAWTGYQKFLALVMVVTGSINTLSTKWADNIDSKGSDGIVRTFQHPFLQALFMFFGEMMCLWTFKLVYWWNRRSGTESQLTQGSQDFNPFILMPAAMFDLIGTSIIYIGLTLTYASSFQMFRGSIIVFVALFSTILLDRVIKRREWFGISQLILGLIIIGATDAIYQSPDDSKGRNSMITGDLLIILAQIILACQMVYEEKFVSGLNIPPLQAVGWEGVFGFSMLSVLLVIFYFIPAPPHFDNNARHTVEDFIDGLVQIGNNSFLLLAIMGTVVSIAFYNFAGISVTKEMSATTRMVLDSVRTLVIWMVSLGVKWQVFHWQHLIGFAILIFGMAVYYDIIPMNSRRPADDETPVVNSEADRLEEA